MITPNGNKLALIQIFDILPGVVLLWRVHDATSRELELVLQAINWFPRRLVVFGKEDNFPKSENVQRKGIDGKLLSLRASAERVGWYISKKETMSDCGSDYLRPAQIDYAAMNAVILHFLPRF
ncbi:hypothetical protein B9Z55_008981 [Caenorhabditis nigoni]|uniref:Uncharacterized protein n=1 Tax=Caenorhabditis nigoni TaxID=1611254 RepID=A0A2G5UQ44_9PELO|nr:hypothetical protein B9Z55_008981 [Caenorhabditis nigoni]